MATARRVRFPRLDVRRVTLEDWGWDQHSHRSGSLFDWLTARGVSSMSGVLRGSLPVWMIPGDSFTVGSWLVYEGGVVTAYSDEAYQLEFLTEAE